MFNKYDDYSSITKKVRGMTKENLERSFNTLLNIDNRNLEKIKDMFEPENWRNFVYKTSKLITENISNDENLNKPFKVENNVSFLSFSKEKDSDRYFCYVDVFGFDKQDITVTETTDFVEIKAEKTRGGDNGFPTIKNQLNYKILKFEGIEDIRVTLNEQKIIKVSCLHKKEENEEVRTLTIE